MTGQIKNPIKRLQREIESSVFRLGRAYPNYKLSVTGSLEKNSFKVYLIKVEDDLL